MTAVAAIGGDDRTVLLMTANVAASGKPVHITEHWVIEDGLIREVRVFWDGLP
jgi:ketosteroid isomerase-like protein